MDSSSVLFITECFSKCCFFPFLGIIIALFSFHCGPFCLFVTFCSIPNVLLIPTLNLYSIYIDSIYFTQHINGTYVAGTEHETEQIHTPTILPFVRITQYNERVGPLKAPSAKQFPSPAWKNLSPTACNRMTSRQEQLLTEAIGLQKKQRIICHPRDPLKELSSDCLA